MDLISKFLAANKNKKLKVHVIGDCMIDENYEVKVTRISPESPNICVMQSTSDLPTCLPGGAANVCCQLQKFNVDVTLAGLMDYTAARIYENAGISTMIGIGNLHVPVKKRFFEGTTQVGHRWDIERPDYGFKNLQEHLHHMAVCYSELDSPDVIILSDYNKGVFKEGYAYLPLKKGVPIIVDPKKGPLDKWRGCTILKPNSEEAEAFTGLSDWKQQCDYLNQATQCEIVITRNSKGVVGTCNQEYFEHKPVRTGHNSVGAGDCFAAVFALAIGHGFNVSDAANIANIAGGAYVQQPRGVVSLWDLQKQSKYATVEGLRNRDYKLAVTNGCYDIVHSGHLECLRVAKSKGDKLVVAVNSDASVTRLKGPNRPVVPLAERMEMLAALEYVDYVISFDEDTPLKLIESILPDVLVKGADWKNQGAVGTKIVPEVYYVPLIKDKSTTNIIEKIKSFTS